MTLRRLSPIALAVALLGSAPLFAQDQNLEPDAEGCRDSTLLSRMKGCRIMDCSAKEFDEMELETGPPVGDGEPPKKTLEGQTEELFYVCPTSMSAVQLIRNAQSALKTSGYAISWVGKTTDDHHILLAEKGGTSVQVRADGWNEYPGYRVKTVRVKAMTQEMTATAAGMAEEIGRTGRVAVYGINFDTGKATIKLDSDAVLGEIAALLRNNAAWKLRVEGHTDKVGAKAANQALSEQRAAAVVAWLAGKGIDRARLSAQGFGDTKPVADNATEAGRAKNRRVELVKQ